MWCSRCCHKFCCFCFCSDFFSALSLVDWLIIWRETDNGRPKNLIVSKGYLVPTSYISAVTKEIMKNNIIPLDGRRTIGWSEDMSIRRLYCYVPWLRRMSLSTLKTHICLLSKKHVWMKDFSIGEDGNWDMTIRHRKQATQLPRETFIIACMPVVYEHVSGIGIWCL